MQSEHGARSSVGRAPDCGSGCRGFESLRAPQSRKASHDGKLFCFGVRCTLSTLAASPLPQGATRGRIPLRRYTRLTPQPGLCFCFGVRCTHIRYPHPKPLPSGKGLCRFAPKFPTKGSFFAFGCRAPCQCTPQHRGYRPIRGTSGHASKGVRGKGCIDILMIYIS